MIIMFKAYCIWGESVKGVVSSLILTLLICNAMLAIGFQSIKASEAVYVNAKRRADSLRNPTQRDRDTYTFVDKTHDPVWVERDNMYATGGIWSRDEQQGAQKKCWVNYFDNTENGSWVFTGDSPYLHNDTDSYITSMGTGNCSWFQFQDTSLTTLQTVYLMIEWKTRHIVSIEEAKLHLDNGASEVDLGSFNLTLEYRWTKINVTSTLDTISKVNDAKLKIVSLSAGFHLVAVLRAYLRIYNGPVPLQTGTAAYSKVGGQVMLSVKWTDPDGLSGYALYHNASGNWIAQTGALEGIEAWSNHTITLQNDAASVLGYRFWANDTDNNWEQAEVLFVYPVKNFSPDLLQYIEDVSGSPIAHSYGRKDFYDNVTGRFWKFYSDGTNIKCTSTENGQTWNSSQTIRVGDSGFQFYVHGFNGTIHYLYNSERTSDNIYYRKGVLNSNGAITWSASEQVAVDAGTSQRFYACAVVTDTDGYPYLVFGNRTDPNSKTINLVKNNHSNGTWQTASGFPKQINENPDNDLVSGVALSLPDNKIYIIYCSAGNEEPPMGRLWHDPTLGPLENASDYTMSSNYHFSTVSDSYGHVHIVYRRTNDRVEYSFRNYTTEAWETKDEFVTSHLTSESLSSAVYSWPVICWNPDSEKVCVHWWTLEDKSAWLKIRNSTTWEQRRRIIRLNREVTLIDGDVIVPQSHQNKILLNFVGQNVVDEQKAIWAYLYTNKPPMASFTESAETVYTGEIIAFNASESFDPDGTIVYYFWNFGDGTNATGVITEHAYADDGNYTVTLTVTDDDEATDSALTTKTVLNRPPLALFTESAETVYTNEFITFNATESYDPDGVIVSYLWNFGDGSNATEAVIEHAYAENANYTVTLRVTDDDEAIHTVASTKIVLNRPPVAIFTESAESVLTGEIIHFNASDSYDPDGFIALYFWDFGDDANATGVTVDHAYIDIGNYTVTLTVTDNDGATDVAMSNKIVLCRDMAVLTVVPCKTIVGTGFNMSIDLTIENQGNFTEDFNVTVYADSIVIGILQVTLNAGDNQTLAFTWDTTGFVYSNYTISATADTVPGEIDTTDNTMVDGLVLVTIPGDVDGDRDVDIYDIVHMSGIYGTSKPDPQYDPNCDIDGDGDIDILDIVAAAGNYGESW